MLKPLENSDLLELYNNIVTNDSLIKKRQVQLKEDDALMRFSGGDARKFLNIIELLANSYKDDEEIVIDNLNVTELLQQNPAQYDKNGDCLLYTSPSPRH